MKKYKILFIIASVLFLLVLSIALIFVFTDNAYIPTFKITGDVEKELKINAYEAYETVTAQRDGSRYNALLLSDLVEEATPYTDEYDVYIKGDDELLVRVDGASLEGMHITYTKENAWEMINYFHPLSSNIKRITEIWVVAGEDTSKIGVSIINQSENLAFFTPGQFYVADTNIANVFEGESEKKYENGTYNVEVFTTRRYMDIVDIVPEAQDLLIMGDEGAYDYDSSPGRIELRGNQLNYVFADGKTTIKNVRGVMISPPAYSNMNAFHDSIEYIKQGDSVIVFLVDGFGYHQYEYAKENNYAPFLKTRPEAYRATTVFQPVTYAGLAAMLTGEPPCVNGVYRRKMPDLKVDDIFKVLDDLGKSSAYIEGNVNILNTSIKPQLNVDDNLNKSTDEEVMVCAEKAIKEGYDFVFIHFHGTDDSGHDTGDLSTQTLEKIKEIDRYMEYLTQDFEGRVIITADHGMHKTEIGGNHGSFMFQDMIIPYVSYDTRECLF